jgi:hypothetical protein
MTKIRTFLKYTNPTIESFLKKTAKDFNEVKKFYMEWIGAFIFFTVIRYAAAAISGYAAFYYFQMFISQIINSIIITIFALVLWQGLLIYFLEKLFKFFLHLEPKYIIPLLIITSGLFVVDYIASTNGLSEKMGNKVNATKTLTDDYNKKRFEVKKYFETRTDSLLIENSRLQKKNTEFNANAIKFNQKNIDKLLKEKESSLLKIEIEHNKNIEKNDMLVEKTSNKYFNIIVIIQILQVFANFFIALYKHLSDEESKEASRKLEQKFESIKDNFVNEIYQNLVTQITSLT